MYTCLFNCEKDSVPKWGMGIPGENQGAQEK